MEKDLVTRLSALGMTKQDLAQSLGVSLSSIYHWRELPKYVQAYLASREREAWKDEVAKAAEARTDTPLADRMTCRVTQYGNLNWHIEPEKDDGRLEVSVLPDSVGSVCAELPVPDGTEGGKSDDGGQVAERPRPHETDIRAGRRRG